MLPGIDAADWFAWACDPREEWRPGEDESCEWLRETEAGIQCRRHPEAMLRDAPHLHDVVTKWRSGVQRELTREDYERLTNFEIECWLVLGAAHGREEVRRMKRRDDA